MQKRNKQLLCATVLLVLVLVLVPCLLSKTMEPPLYSPTQAFHSRDREETQFVEIYITARFE